MIQTINTSKGDVKSVDLHCSEVEFLIIRSALRKFIESRDLDDISRIMASEMLEKEWAVKEGD